MNGNSGGFSNPVFGGNVLIRPAVKSPNYQAGVQGWQIARDGSAEFNNLVIRGTFNGTDFVINSSGIFLYSGTPAAGNLVGSWASAAGSDTFGNTYPAGIGLQKGVGRLTVFDSANATRIIVDGTTGIKTQNASGTLNTNLSSGALTLANTSNFDLPAQLDVGGAGLEIISPSSSVGTQDADTRIVLVPGDNADAVHASMTVGAINGLTETDVTFRIGTFALTTPAGTALFTVDDTGAVTITNGGSLTGTFTGTPTFTGAPAFHSSGVNVGILTGRVTGFANDTFQISGGGGHDWGGGGSAFDTNLYRSAANTLKTDDSFVVGQDLFHGSTDLGHGIQSQVSISANVSGLTTTETALMTIPSMTFVNNRAYRVTLWGLANSTTASTYFLYKLRKGTASTTGTVYKDQMRVPVLGTASTNSAVSLVVTLVNTSGADITTDVTWTGSCAAGTGVFAASANNLATATIEDVGLASQWPGQPIS